jgi:hypothetical protein
MRSRKMESPRLPNEQEISELIRYQMENGGLDVEEANELVNNSAYMSVFDDYITDGPCYAGKVMAAVWSGSPEFYEVFVWIDGKMKKVEQDEGMKGKVK